MRAGMQWALGTLLVCAAGAPVLAQEGKDAPAEIPHSARGRRDPFRAALTPLERPADPRPIVPAVEPKTVPARVEEKPSETAAARREREERERDRRFSAARPAVLGVVRERVAEPADWELGVNLIGRPLRGTLQVRIDRVAATALLRLGNELRLVTEGEDLGGGLRVRRIESHFVAFRFEGAEYDVALGDDDRG